MVRSTQAGSACKFQKLNRIPGVLKVSAGTRKVVVAAEVDYLVTPI